MLEHTHNFRSPAPEVQCRRHSKVRGKEVKTTKGLTSAHLPHFIMCPG